MGWSIFWHGTFDFLLFSLMVLQPHWSTGGGDDAVSYVLMACVVIICFTGLGARIHKVRNIVFNRVEGPDDLHLPQGPQQGDGGVGPDGAAPDLEAGIRPAAAEAAGSAAGVSSGHVVEPGPVRSPFAEALGGPNAGFSRLQDSEHEPVRGGSAV